MELLKTDSLKLPNMIMCGDHPSLTKTELNLKEIKVPESRELQKKLPMSFPRISPTSSRTERPGVPRAPSRPQSEHGLSLRTRTEALPRQDNRELLQAAIGSFRWPPYLVLAWLLLLATAHALHALAAALAAALPAIRKLCQYFREQTTENWQKECELAQRLRPVLLACVTVVLYALLGVLVVSHALVRWAVEPLVDEHPSIITQVTDYIDFDNIFDGKK